MLKLQAYATISNFKSYWGPNSGSHVCQADFYQLGHNPRLTMVF